MGFITVKEAAERYGVSEKTIRKWASGGQVEAVGRGRALTISDEGMPARKEDAKEASPVGDSPELKAQEIAEAMRISKAKEAKAKADEAEALQREKIIKEFGGTEKFDEAKFELSERERKLKESDDAVAKSLEDLERLKETVERRQRLLDTKEQSLKDTNDYQREVTSTILKSQADIAKRKADLSVVEKSHLAERKVYTSRLERQRRAMPMYLKRMSSVVNIIASVKGLGLVKIADKIWDDIEEIKTLIEADFDTSAEDILEIMRDDVREANKVAIKLSRIYDKSEPNIIARLMGQKADNASRDKRDDIVGNLESIVNQLRELKPDEWCDFNLEDEILQERVEEFMRKAGNSPVSFDAIVAELHITRIDNLEWLLNFVTPVFYIVRYDETVGHYWGLVANRNKMGVN